MSHELEFVVKGALMLCDKGSMPSPFEPTNGEGVEMDGLTTSNSLDKIANKHIMPFGACSIQSGKPCTPAPLEWQDTYGVRINGGKSLLKKSCIQCAIGGKISFLNSGQLQLPQEELDSLLEENTEIEEDGSAWGWWDTAELIPVVGNVIGMVREAKKGNWGMFALNVGFLALDVFTLGSASLITAPAKGAVKGVVKFSAKKTAQKLAQATSKAITKGGAKKLVKGGAEALAKGITKATAKLATAKGIVCIMACFVRGTLIAVKNGQKPIEEIRVGDLVWAFNEKTGKQALKKVVQTIEKQTNATIELTLDNETIITTAEHPFYTKQGWKQATDLTLEDQLQTIEQKWHSVKAIHFNYQKETVYNFEVEDYHTYFVGKLKWLVHNTKVCLVGLAKAGVKYAKNILNGQMFDKAMRKAYGAANSQIKMANGKFLDVLTNKEIISHKFTQLSEVTFDTAKNYIDEIGRKYANQTTNSRKLAEQVDTFDMKQILEIPPQKIKNEQYQKLVEYAKDVKDVEIREISGKALEEFNKIKDLMY